MLLTVLKFVDLFCLLSVSGLIGLIAAEIWGRCNEGYVVHTVCTVHTVYAVHAMHTLHTLHNLNILGTVHIGFIKI